MDCKVIGFIALDEILGFFFGGMVGVAFEFHIRKDLLHDDTANSTCFRIPFDVIAAFEALGHLTALSFLLASMQVSISF